MFNGRSKPVQVAGCNLFKLQRSGHKSPENKQDNLITFVTPRNRLWQQQYGEYNNRLGFVYNIITTKKDFYLSF